jgi:Flp pilus assembly protein TadD
VRLRTARGESTPNDVAARQILMEAAQSMDGEPIEARVLLAAGELRLKRGEPEDANRYLAKASALEPKNPEIWLSLGRALALLQDDPGARHSFEQAAQLEPDSSRALEELAQLAASEPARQAALLLRAGDRAARSLDSRGAHASFARAIKLDPSTSAAAKEHAAALYARIGDSERARATWQEAIDAGGATPAGISGVAQSSRALGENEARRTLQGDRADPRTGSASWPGRPRTETGRAAEATAGTRRRAVSARS